MRHRQAAGLGSSIAALGAIVAFAAPGAASASPAAVQIRGSAPPAAAKSPAVGSVPGRSTVDFRVALHLRDEKGAAAFARAVSTPGSAQYGKYLTAAQWEQRFSPSAAEVARVSTFLRQSGFKVHGASADRMTVSASGTASQVEHVFATSLSYHRVHGARVRLADRNLSVPSALAGSVLGFLGVSQSVAHPNHTTGEPAPAAAPSSEGSPFPPPAGFRAAQPCGDYYNQKIDTILPPFGHGYPTNPPWAVCGYKPPQLRSAYNLTGANDGSGVTVAVVDAFASPTIFSDAKKYASLNDPSHPLNSSQFSQQLSSTFSDSDVCGTAGGWYGEETLDVEAVHATAPGAKILFAGAKNCFTDSLNAAVQQIVDNHSANVISNSYGDNGGDVLDSPADRESTDHILQMAAATGITVMFSSGDNGDEFAAIGAVAADYPASSPWATAVGGTSLQIGADGQRLGEFGWSSAKSVLCTDTYAALGGCEKSQVGTWGPIDQTFLAGAGGGGTSRVYPQPFYQRGVVPASLSKRDSSEPMRVEPDVSMDGDPATGFLVGETQVFPNGTYYDQYRIGGTSLSSPLLAGVVARAVQGAGHPLGFLNPALYSLYGQSSALNDVLPAGKQIQSRADYANGLGPADGLIFSTRIIDYEGDETFCATDASSSCSTRKVAISTAPGFDSMTGLGSPGSGFVSALSGH